MYDTLHIRKCKVSLAPHLEAGGVAKVDEKVREPIDGGHCGRLLVGQGHLNVNPRPALTCCLRRRVKLNSMH